LAWGGQKITIEAAQAGIFAFNLSVVNRDDPVLTITPNGVPTGEVDQARHQPTQSESRNANQSP